MAQSREELPQLSPATVMTIPIKISIKGNNQDFVITGHVAGLSDRINSVLIPESFMKWANAKFGYTQQQQRITRIVLKTKDPSDPKLVNYLNEKKLHTNTDKTRFSKARTAVNIIVNLLAGIGIVMLLFALLVFSLFIQITIASCKKEIELLITLGASPKKLGKFLMRQFFPSNIIIIFCCIVLIGLLQYIAATWLQGQNLYISKFINLFTVGAALIVLATIWLVYKQTLRKYLTP